METRSERIRRVERSFQAQIDKRAAKDPGCGHGAPGAVCSDCGDGGMPGCGCGKPECLVCLVESLSG
jgi:hypothetical protein